MIVGGRLKPIKRLLILTSLFALLGGAAAIAETRIYSAARGGSFPVEPQRLEYSPSEGGVGQSYVFEKLDWKHWGHRKARSRANMYSCADPGPCFTARAELTAKRKRRSGGGAYYTKLATVFGQNRVVIRLRLPRR